MKRYGLVRLVWRQFGSERGASIAIAGVVLLVAFASAAAPRALELTTSAELARSISSLPPTQSALTAELLDGPTLGPSQSGEAFEGELDTTWGALDDTLRAVRDDIAEPARALIGEPRFAVSTSPVDATSTELAPTAPLTRLVFLSDPRFTAQVELTAGEWPIAPDHAIAPPFDPSDGVMRDPLDAPIEFALSTATAERMQWAIGEVRSTKLGVVQAQRVQLVGTFDPRDENSDYWQYTPTTLEADYFDDGNSRPIATGGAYIASEGWSTVSQVVASSRVGTLVRTRVWFPIDGTTITASSAPSVLSQLRQATSAATPIGEAVDGGQPPRVTFSTGIVDALDAVTARSSATTSVLLLATTGPLGVAIAVIALAGRLVAERRRPTLSLIAARGGSNAQLRSILALEGLVLGLPAALGGVVAALLLVPGDGVTAQSLALPALVGAAPAAILALAASPGSLRQVRTDLGSATTSRRRVIVELVGIVLAVASVVLLLVRGIGEESPGVDPLLVAAPLLLTLAACVLVLRVYPIPLAALERRLRERSGVVAFVGTARALRDPVAGLAPVLAMVVAVSVAVFSGAMFATLTNGVDDAVESSVGGDFRARGPIFSDEALAAVSAVEGVEGAAQLEDAGTSSLASGRVTTPVTVILGDAATLAAVQSGLSDAAPPLPANDAAASIVVSASVAARLDSLEGITINGSPVTVVGTQARIAGSGVTGDWIYADRSAANVLTTGDFLPRVLVVRYADGAHLENGIREALGSSVSTATRASVDAQIRSSAFVGNLQLALAILIALVAVLCATAVLLVSTINTRSRERLLAVLRTLGFSRRQSTTLVAWELAPIAVTAFVGGTLLGVALPLIVLAGIDLTPFTGGTAQPALTLDPFLTAAVLGGFAIVVGATSFVAALGTRSLNLAASLRTGEE
jgi:putative ABC transport system permease protein